jgi:hypothetical protein
MKSRAAIAATTLLAFSVAPSLAGQEKRQPKKHITGLYRAVSSEAGSYYGCSILIYRGIDYWAVYQKADEQEMIPVSAHAIVAGDSVEFTVETEPGHPATFKGKIKGRYLVGQFDNSSIRLKLQRIPL